MKKFVKLSLAAAVATAGLTTVASANTLAEAFAASKVKGEIKSQYFEKETTAGAESSIFVNGGSLGIVTGSFNGLTAGVTFQTSHVGSVDGTGYASDMDASGSVLSESYLAYKISNTTAKIGRQYISTPLVGVSGSRMIKTSFEGITVVNTDIQNTTLVAGYVDKIANRTDSAGDVDGFNQVSTDGAYTVLAVNKSLPNTVVTAQYATLLDDAGDEDVELIEAVYNADVAKISGQFLTSNKDGQAKRGELFGLKVNANVANIALTAAYTTTSKDANVQRGYGAGAFPAYTKLTIGSGGYAYGADTNSYLIHAATTLAGVKLALGYASYDDNAANTQDDETELNLGYAFNKNASANVVFTKFGGDAETKDYNSRVYFSYKF